MPVSIGTPGLYASFTGLVIALLAVDFFMLKKEGAHKVGTGEAAGWSLVWVTIALSFGALFWCYLDGTIGPDAARARALAYFTGYLIEKSLAVDNIFVWITLFQYFAVPAALQKRVLLYGVLGDMAQRFHLLKYGLAAILIFIGAKMLLLDVYKVPIGVALGAVGLILAVAVAASLLTSTPARRS